MSKSKLHDVFLEGHQNTEHVKRVRDILFDELKHDLDSKKTPLLAEKQNKIINGQDKEGNTILHLMVLHLTKNYYTFLDLNRKKFPKPGENFLKDLKDFLKLGADLTIKNKDGNTAIDLLLGNTKDLAFVSLGIEFREYFDIIQGAQPKPSSLIKIIQYATQKDGTFSHSGNDSFDLPTILDYKQLPLECLQVFKEQIQIGGLTEILPTDIKKIEENIDKEIKYRELNTPIANPLFLPLFRKLIQKDLTKTLLRGLCFDHAITYYINKLLKLDLEQFLLLVDYQPWECLIAEYGIWEKSFIEKNLLDQQPLNSQECSLLDGLAEELAQVFDGHIKQEAYKHWQRDSLDPNQLDPNQKEMLERLSFFNNKNAYNKVLEELNLRFKQVLL